MKAVPALRLLILVAALFSVQAAGAAAQAPARSIPSTIPIPDGIYSGLVAAIQGRAANVLPGDKLIITSLDKSDGWAISTVARVPDVPDEGETLLAQSTLAIVHLASGKWSGALLGTAEFDRLLTNLPQSFVSTRAKGFLREPRVQTELSPQGISTVLKWPFRSGQTWEYTQGRHGTNNASIDLAPYDIIPPTDRAVVAAASGVIIRKCEDDVQSMVAVRHSTGTSSDDVTGYLHMDKTTVNRATGSFISQGETIGITYNSPIASQPGRCGYSTGPHVHFSTGTLPAGSNDGGQITLTDIAGSLLSGWLLGADNCFTRGAERRCVLDDFVSDNGALPTIPSSPGPIDGAVLARTTPVLLTWSTNGTLCDYHVWGGSIDLAPPVGSCGSLGLGVQKGGSYQWQIMAHNSAGDTAGPIWRFSIQPYAPSALTATTASASTVDLAWTKSADDPGDVDGYRVYKSNGTLVANLPAGTTAYQATGLACNTAASFYVNSVRQGVESASSNTATATPSCTCFTLTKSANPAGGGTIGASPGPNCNNGTQYAAGTQVTLTATASAGYVFSGWSGALTGLTNPASVTMSDDKTVTAVFTPVTGSLANGDFEKGRGVGWTEYSSGGYSIVSTRKPHAGSYSAYLCEYNNCKEYVEQKITVPATTPTLTYWYYMTSAEGTTYAYDYLRVRLFSVGGTLLGTPRTISNRNTRNAWVKDTVSLSNYAGKTVILRLVATTNASLATAFYVDDVTLASGAAPPPPPPPTCYTLTAASNPAGAGILAMNPLPNCNSATQYTSGTTVSITASPNSGYTFGSWSGCDSSSGNNCQVTVNAARSVTANFSPVVVTTLVNGNFESGRGVGWTEYSSGGYAIVGTRRPHSGSYSAYLCDYNNCTEYVEQKLTIPAGAPTLTFWWYMTSSETSTTADDVLRVRLYSTAGTLLTSLRGRSNLGVRNAWFQDSVSLSAYAGQTVVLRVMMTTDSAYPSAFYIDDIVVK